MRQRTSKQTPVYLISNSSSALAQDHRRTYLEVVIPRYTTARATGDWRWFTPTLSHISFLRQPPRSLQLFSCSSGHVVISLDLSISGTAFYPSCHPSFNKATAQRPLKQLHALVSSSNLFCITKPYRNISFPHILTVAGLFLISSVCLLPNRFYVSVVTVSVSAYNVFSTNSAPYFSLAEIVRLNSSNWFRPKTHKLHLEA